MEEAQKGTNDENRGDTTPHNGDEQAATSEKDGQKAQKRRDIGGNIPYTQSAGVLERALRKLIESERPDSFSRDFLATVLEITGGASMPVIPILKRAGLLDAGGHPTPLYSEFQGDSTRANAALVAMRNAFDDIFQRNKFAHKADAEKIKDIIRSVTGLPKNDRIIGWMYNTFNVFQKFAANATEAEKSSSQEARVEGEPMPTQYPSIRRSGANVGLAYNINITLPNTTNIDVYNKIFRSLRENLLDG